MDKKKAIFLDRDGVINEAIVKNGKPYSPNNISELKINPNAKELIKYLKFKDYLTLVVTNQPDVERKKAKKENVIEINNFLKKSLNLDDVFVCYSGDDNCPRRKPNPGMIFDAQKKWDIDLSLSYLIGDRSKDIDAGLNAGVKTIFIDYNYDEKKPIYSNYTVYSLKDVKKIII
tara:strand:- start:1003 stop:1524 length:522 start_codon:yes stop_codon:yes gene_type:complete